MRATQTEIVKLILGSCTLTSIVLLQVAPQTLSNILSNIIYNAIVASIIASFISVYLIGKWNYRRAFNRLCDEIDDNYKRMSINGINEQTQRMRRIHRKNLEFNGSPEWVGFGKKISIWTIAQNPEIIGRDQYRYLQNNEYRSFITNGFYGQINSDYLENLVLFYFYCEAFSVVSQNIEKGIISNRALIHKHPIPFDRNEWENNFESKLAEIIVLYWASIQTINEPYQNIRYYFQRLPPWFFLFEEN